MKFNREHLEELTLQKIKEVNHEAGYRKYLEVPEMVNIIASIVEEKFRVEYDDLANQIHLLSKELDKAQIKAEDLEEEHDSMTHWKELEEIKSKYYELILNVESKHSEETRHQTALRYIREKESNSISSEENE
jgi:hypothetical protein